MKYFHNTGSMQRRSSLSAERRGSSSPDSYFNRRVPTDDSMLDARSNRIAQTEAAVRQEMFKDYTFKPQIKALPNAYGAVKDDKTPFYQRVTKWQKEKEVEASKRKELSEETEVKGN